MFKLLLTRTFAKELKKLEKEERERIKKKLPIAAKAPWSYFQRLTGHNLFRLRVGKYRIIANINSREKTITLVSVKHRGKAYKRI